MSGSKALSDTSITIAMFGLVGALLGAVPGILGVFFTWLRNRDSVQRSLKKVELAQAEVELIGSWLTVVSKLDDDDFLQQKQQTARDRLDGLMASIDAQLERDVVDTVAQRKPQRSLGFYIYSGFFFAMLLGTAVDDNDDFSWDYFAAAIVGEDGFILLLFALPWLYLLVKHIRARLA
ncbi:MAG: hypothetical protein V7707_15925 [Motiliproteus sp.]